MMTVTSGFVFDTTHSYAVPIVAGACANAIAAVIVMRTCGSTISSPAAGKVPERDTTATG
jgi:hypothetical protein